MCVCVSSAQPTLPKLEETTDKAKVHGGLIRRKSTLPADFDTAVAIKQYHTVDKVLQPSKEA